MTNKYFATSGANQSVATKYHNSSQVMNTLNSRNTSKQVNNYAANKIIANKYDGNKSHSTSVSHAKDPKRMKKLVYLSEQTTKNRIKPQLKASCDSVRKSQKRSAKNRYYEKMNSSKISETRKPSSKSRKKKNFNNTTKLSSHFINAACDQYVVPMTANSKYTMSINTNRHANMSINLSNNRSGAK